MKETEDKEEPFKGKKKAKQSIVIDERTDKTNTIISNKSAKKK